MRWVSDDAVRLVGSSQAGWRWWGLSLTVKKKQQQQQRFFFFLIHNARNAHARTRTLRNRKRPLSTVIIPAASCPRCCKTLSIIKLIDANRICESSSSSSEREREREQVCVCERKGCVCHTKRRTRNSRNRKRYQKNDEKNRRRYNVPVSPSNKA